MARQAPPRAKKLSVSPICLRRSSRLAQVQRSKPQEQQRGHQQLPSPIPSQSPPTNNCTRKRKLESESASAQDTGPRQKRLRSAESSELDPFLPHHDPVAHWVATFSWPPSAISRSGMTSAPTSKRRGSSSHSSEKRKRLEENGIYMKSSVLLRQESKEYCKRLLKGQCEPSLFPCYPASRLEDVLERVHELNEARLQRDVMPWVVPSAENLHFSGVIDGDYIGEELDTEWSRCETMGSTRPKPDFAAGLKRSAFSAEEDSKLQNYSTAQHPYLFTPDLTFPFLMCEAKTGRVGLDYADTQNIHSASIATRAIVSLYRTTFGKEDDRTKDLFGRILVFSVSHNDRVVNVYGHYAVPDHTDSEDGFRYFRYDIAMFSLTLYEGKERFMAYNFVKQLYEQFAPQHFERIRNAVQWMPKPAPRTGLSFAASDVTLEEGGSQSDSGPVSQGDEAFKIPNEPASASQSRELVHLKVQLDRLLQQMEQQKEASRKQEEASRKREEASRKREEASRKREDALERRLDQIIQNASKSAE